MRILYLGFDIEGVGGIATYSRYQIRALKRLGHSVTVVSLNKTDIRGAERVVDRHLPFGSRGAAIANGLRVALGARGKADLVMVNHVFLAGFALALKTVSGTPYVINVYNIDILTRLPRLRETAFARADLVIADCQYTIDHLPTYHPVVPPTGLLYDPVDTQAFRPQPRAQARAAVAAQFGFPDLSNRFLAVTVAAMLEPPNKGHRQTIDALARLDDPRFAYLVVGDGPDRKAILAYAEERGVADRLFLTGRAPQEWLPALYSAADVAILVARGGPGWGEAVPLGLIEASACGVPFICGNEDGSIEALDPAKPNGIAIPPLDIEALADALTDLAAAPERTEAMGRNGIAVVADRFVFERFVEQQGRLLEQHIAPRRKAA